MILDNHQLNLPVQFETQSYRVYLNVEKVPFGDNKDDNAPNYLVVNAGNNALEFGVEQLPAGIELALRCTKAIREMTDNWEKEKSVAEFSLAKAN